MIAELIICILSAAGIATGLKIFHSGWTAILLYHAILLGALLLGVPRRANWRSIFEGYRTGPALGLALLSCGMGLGFFLQIRQWDPSGTHVLLKLSHLGFSFPSFWLFVLYASVVNPMLEELFWRGDPAHPKGWVFDIFYALLHLPILLSSGKLAPVQVVVPVVGLVLAGLLWRLVAKKQNGLASSIIGHGTADLALLVAVICSLR